MLQQNERLISTDTSSNQGYQSPIKYSIKQEFTNDDLNNKNFVGCHFFQKYKIIRGYINGKGPALKLYYTKFQPQKKKANLCIIHGIAQNHQNYLDLCDSFAKLGFVVHSIDLRGFGFSGGQRLNFSMEQLHQDIQVLLGCCNPNLPVFMFGHGFGALSLITLLIHNKNLNISGIILSSIYMPKQKKYSWLKNILIQIFDQSVFLSTQMEPTKLIKNTEKIFQRYTELFYFHFQTVKMYKQIQKMKEIVQDKSFEFNYPCLIIHGKKDQITSFHKSSRFFQKISSYDKTFKLYQDGYHELLNDLQSKDVTQCIIQWVKKRVNKGKKLGLIKKTQYQKPKKLSLKVIFFLIISLVIVLKQLKKIKPHNFKIL